MSLEQIRQLRTQRVQESVTEYIQEHGVDDALQDILSKLLYVKPDNPRQWLLDTFERELSSEKDELSESELQNLLVAMRKITSEIVPRDTVDLIISETMKILHCEVVSLYVVDKGGMRLFASNLDHPMPATLQGIPNTVFNSGTMLNISDCTSDDRFDPSFDQTGRVTKSLLAAPIVDFDLSVLGVLQAVNKMPRGEQPFEGADTSNVLPFDRNDEQIVEHLTQHVGIALRNAQLYREAVSASDRATGLLNTIQSLSLDLGTQSLLLTITMHANKIVSAQRSTVFLLDEANQQLWSVSTDTGQEIRIPCKAGIAGQCCQDSKIINIPDAYADSRFNQEIDKRTGFKTHSILAIPIFVTDPTDIRRSRVGAEVRQVIGVIQMINKNFHDGEFEAFDSADVDVMELFAKFVSPQLTHSSLLQRKQHQDSDMSEGESALRQVALAPILTAADRARKRRSTSTLEVPSEDVEGEKDAEN